MLSDHYWHQTTNDFEKLLEQENVENTSKVAYPIFLIINMHIWPTRLLEVDLFNTKYNLEGKLCEGCTGIDEGHESEIEEDMATRKNKEDDDKDS